MQETVGAGLVYELETSRLRDLKVTRETQDLIERKDSVFDVDMQVIKGEIKRDGHLYEDDSA